MYTNDQYKPTLSVLFDNVRLEPSPFITVNKEPIYTNDSVTGFTYSLDIRGYASSVVHTKELAVPGVSTTLQELSYIHELFTRNGKNLEIICYDTGGLYMRAVGSHLKSFSVEPNENQWINYIEYKATIEFTDLVFTSAYNQTSIGIANDSVATQDPILALQLLRLRSYQDSWNFEVPENEAYLYYSRITSAGVLATEDYSQINVSYTINATGKHFYIDGLTTAAWENAKNFVQKKLFYQIFGFRAGGLLNQQGFINSSYNSNDLQANTLNDALTSIYFTPAIPPILDASIVSRYKIYNESISCSTSQSDGTFSATYNCVLKRFDPSIAAPLNSIHTFTVNYDETNDFEKSNRTITVQGSLQGLLPTNILQAYDNDGQTFVLPENGIFFGVDRTNINTKYAFAWEDFRFFIANEALDDLRDNFKNVLGINYASLFPQTNINSPCNVDGYNALYQILALPKSFSVSHNYSAGTIDYTSTYDTERSCAAERGFESMTVTEEDSIPAYSEFTVIGRASGPILQNLNTNKPKNITIAFNGVTRKGCANGNPFSSGTLLTEDVCNTDAYVFISDNVKEVYAQTELGFQMANQKLITKTNDISYNAADGSYNVSKSYLVCPPKPIDCST